MTLYYSPSLRRFVKGLTDERPSAVLYLTSSIENLTIIFVASGGGELALSGATASIAIGTFPTFSSVLATANSWILANDNKSATFEVTIDTVEMRVALGTASHVDVVAQLYLTVSSELVASKLAPTRVINSIVRDGTEPPTVSEDLLWNWLKLRAPEANGFEHDDELRTLTVVSVDQIARDAAADAQSTANGKLSPDGDGSQLTGVVSVDQTARDAASACLPLAGGTMNDGAIVAFVNGSKLKVGTNNAGTGGNGGIAQVCSVDYEKKWEAGATYIMQQDGFTIRTLRDALGEPGSTHDTTKGFVVGTRWIQDNGDAWICRDATESAAVWEALCDCEIGVALSDETTDLTTGTDIVKFSMPYAMYVRDLFLCCSTTPTGSTIEVTAKVGGSSFAGAAIPVDSFDSIGHSGLDPGLLARGAVISFDTTAVGSTIPGKGLKVWLRGSRR